MPQPTISIHQWPWQSIFLLIVWSLQTTLVFIKSLEDNTLGKFALNSTLQISILILPYVITSYFSCTVTAHSFIRMTKPRVRVSTYSNLIIALTQKSRGRWDEKHCTCNQCNAHQHLQTVYIHWPYPWCKAVNPVNAAM